MSEDGREYWNVDRRDRRGKKCRSVKEGVCPGPNESGNMGRYYSLFRKYDSTKNGSFFRWYPNKDSKDDVIGTVSHCR